MRSIPGVPGVQIERVVDSLENLTRMHERVSDKTSSLHKSCEHILAELVGLSLSRRSRHAVARCSFCSFLRFVVLCKASLSEAVLQTDCRLQYFDVLEQLSHVDARADKRDAG